MPAAPLALSVLALGCALRVNLGQYHPAALAWVTVALGGMVLCVAKPRSRVVAALESRRTAVLACALLVQFVLLLVGSPGATGALADDSHLGAFRLGVVAAGVLCGLACCAGGRWQTAATAALLLVHLALGAWVLRAAPDPGIDVALFQREAAGALARGDNPYAITFRDPYGGSSPFYGPGVSVNGRLQFGYPYPPLGLLLTTPAHLLGDFRYAHLFAMTLAGALLAFARPGRIAVAAAALLLFTPRGFFVLEAGWTEPFAVLFLAGTVFTLCRAPRSAAVPLGLLLASKQYLVLALLAAPLLKRHRALLAGAAAVAGMVTLPLALWDLPAFVRSAVLLQFRQPFREDALSYLVPLAEALGRPQGAWIAFVMAALAGVLCLRKLPRTPAGFACAVALVFLAFFAFNKQAFCNYYHFVIGAACCAIAPASCPTPSRQEHSTTA